MNPNQRALFAQYRTYIDVNHVQRDEKTRLFTIKTRTRQVGGGGWGGGGQRDEKTRLFTIKTRALKVGGGGWGGGGAVGREGTTVDNQD